jgi:predicted MFS family arabinose efflux permease
MGLLAQHAQLTLHRMMGFAVFAGFAAAVSMPASFRFLREIVPAERLPEAYALLIFQYDLSRMAGPSLAALLIPLFGIAGNFFLNAVSFVPGLLWMGWYMTRGSSLQPDGGHRSAEASYGAVFQVVRSSPALKACLGLTACFGLFAWNHLALLPVYAARYLRLESKGMASLMTILGFGAIWASLWLARGRITNHRRWIGACFALYGVLLILWGICPEVHAAYALCILIGPVQAMMWLLLNGQVQRLSPAHLSGRMAALFLTLGMGLMPIGNLAAGEAAQGLGRQGPRWVLAAGGLLVLVAAILFRLYSWGSDRASLMTESSD